MGVDDAQLRRLLDRVRREVDDGLIPSCQVSLGSSAHWVLAEIIEEVAGSDFRNEIHARVTEPLGLGRLLGLGPAEQDNIADLVLVGEHATADELEAAFGVRELPRTEVTDDVIAVFNEPEMRELGMARWWRLRDGSRHRSALSGAHAQHRRPVGRGIARRCDLSYS